MKHDELNYLRAENARLREVIKTLTEVDGFAILKLTHTEHKILSILYKRRATIDYDIIWDMLYWDRVEPPQMRAVTVLLCLLRRKLKPFNIKILTSWGKGLSLTQNSLKILDNIVAEAKEISNDL